MSSSGSEFLQRLIRHLYATPAVSAAFLGGDLAQAAPAVIERIDLHLVIEPAFPMAAWLEEVGESAFSGPERDGWRLVSPDGVEYRFYLADQGAPVAARGLQPLFDRRGEVVPGEGQSLSAGGCAPAIDLGLMAGRFWADLHRAAGALSRGWPLTAHGHLEECRRALVDLYRIALAPREGGQGWEGSDRLPGVEQALRAVREWLVAPLDLRAQWRSAHRLAVAYESLMLPLCQRLGVEYPMAMRNLAFGRLEEARPDQPRPDQGAACEAGRERRVTEQEVMATGGGRMRLTRGRIRRS